MRVRTSRHDRVPGAGHSSGASTAPKNSAVSGLRVSRWDVFAPMEGRMTADARRRHGIAGAWGLRKISAISRRSVQFRVGCSGPGSCATRRATWSSRPRTLWCCGLGLDVTTDRRRRRGRAQAADADDDGELFRLMADSVPVDGGQHSGIADRRSAWTGQLSHGRVWRQWLEFLDGLRECRGARPYP
jgi:hypothetical protein